MGRFERQMRRREAKAPYKLIDHLLRRQVPDALAAYGLDAVARPLRSQPQVVTEQGAYLSVQALAAITVAQSALCFEALKLLGERDRATLLARAPELDQIMEQLSE